MKNVWTGPVTATLSTTPPSPTGWAQDSVPGTVNPTVPGAHWFNMITAELMSVLSMGGVTADGGNFGQVAVAITNKINAIIAGDFPYGGTLTNGWQTWPSGVKAQWCQVAVGSTWGSDPVLVTVTYPTAFVSAANAPRISLVDASSPGLGNELIYAVQSYTLTGCVVQVSKNGGGQRAFTVCVDVRGT